MLQVRTDILLFYFLMPRGMFAERPAVKFVNGGELLTGSCYFKTSIECCKVVQSEDVTPSLIKIASDNNNFTIFNFACILVDLECRVTSKNIDQKS